MICEANRTACNYTVESIYDLVRDEHPFPRADVVVGGFPCQDFSHAGKRQGFRSTTSHDLKSAVRDGASSRGTLYRCFVEVVRRVSPKVFVAENVYGLLTMKGDPIDTIVREFAELGYAVRYQVVKCEEIGVPQTRKRVIIMGVRTDARALTGAWDTLPENDVRCTVGEYLRHLREPGDSPDPAQQLYSKARRMARGQGQKEVDLASYAPTIRAEHHGNIEFRRHANSTVNAGEAHLPERRLTVREAGLIQTFPPAFNFTPRRNQKAYKYIGNAVPPLLGYLIAARVKQLLRDHF